MPDAVAHDRQARIASLLEDTIRAELQAQNATAGLGLPQAAITRLAHGIAAEVLYAFAVDWSPDWVRPGQAHTWQASGDFFARCPVCLQDSPPRTTCEGATAWAASHQAAHDPGHRQDSPEPGQEP